MPAALDGDGRPVACDDLGLARRVAAGRTGGSPTIGFGQMVKVGEAWAFEMQMSTDRGDNRLLHWANMVEAHEGEASWNQLPGLDLSVPQMLAGAVYPRFETE